MATKGSLRVCPEGHRYYKSTDCPTCPICENERRPEKGFMSTMAAPARRALEREGITTLIKLAKRTEREILSLHGIGPSTISGLRQTLKKEGLAFKK